MEVLAFLKSLPIINAAWGVAEQLKDITDVLLSV